jgi:hypothetical protein
MNLFRARLLRGLLGVALFLTTIAAPLARAQEAGAPAAPSSKKNYVYQYFLVGLCVTLGMAVMCRPAHRETQLVKETSDTI